MIRRASCILVVLLAPLHAATIDSVSGPYHLGLDLHQALVASWSSTIPYIGVSIAAELTGGPGNAYLMTQIGPGTTVADQIATTSFAILGGGLTPLFSGLDLNSGTYYLVITNSGNGFWWSADSPTIVTGSGVTRLTDQIATPSGYAPASSFHGLSSDLIVDVTGTASPEPGALLLLSAGAAALIAIRRKVVSD